MFRLPEKAPETLLANLPGWQRPLLIFLSGALLSTSLPPADLWPVVFLTFPVLIFALDNAAHKHTAKRARLKAGFVAGWLFGFGYFVTSLYWIGAAFLVEPDKFALLIPFAVAALPAFLALFWGLATGFSVLLWSSGFSRVIVLAVFLTLAEWLRGHVLTGFPWNVIGFASSGMGGISQLAAFVGIYGVTFFVLVWAGLGVALVGSARKPLLPMALAASFMAVWLAGNLRVPLSGLQGAQGPLVRIVQPAIAQNEKWPPKFRRRNIDLLFSLSARPTGEKTPAPKIIVWPESALPVLFEQSPALRQRVAKLLAPGSFLIMGAIRRLKAGDGAEFYNSVLVVNHRGETIARYDKSHLVPFGEYLPYENIFSWLGLRKLVTLPGGFKSGSGSKLLSAKGLPAFTAAICYEIIFPSRIMPAHQRAQWIVNLTNDAWFGNTAGPYQHFAQARFRAIEQGVPVVRAANSGISGVISPYGTTLASVALGRRDVLDFKLPRAGTKTVYSQTGDGVLIIGLICILMIYGLAFWASRSRIDEQ